jgi:hypothetical protein
MKCPACDGTGDGLKPGDGNCSECSGWGTKCDYCGEGCSYCRPDFDLCDECMKIDLLSHDEK